MSRLDEAREAARRKPVYDEAVAGLIQAFRRIECLTPKPVETEIGGRTTYRYSQQTIEAAIFLKLTRLVSLVRSMLILLEEGLIQEQCILQRGIEETNEDIVFLALAVTQQSLTEKHRSFLEDFWKEDYANSSDPVATRIPRAFNRRGIRAFINRALGQPDPSSADAASRSIYEMYSGFLHGAAPHIIELYDEHAEQFLLGGIAGKGRYIDYVLDAQNSIYRSLISIAFVTKAFGLPEELERVQSMVDRFVKDVGPAWILKS